MAAEVCGARLASAAIAPSARASSASTSFSPAPASSTKSGPSAFRNAGSLPPPTDSSHPLGLAQVSRLTIRSQRDHAVQAAITEVLEKAGRRRPQRAVRREGGRDWGEDPGEPGNAHLAILWTAGARA